MYPNYIYEKSLAFVADIHGAPGSVIPVKYQI